VATLSIRPAAGPGADPGMVFQSYTQLPRLTVQENICSGQREKGMDDAGQRRLAEHFIAPVGLCGFERHYPKMLSGGMQQSTALARALANEPKVLLMDEPFGALDHQTRELMQALLLDTRGARHDTVLFMTHDIDETIFMANRVVLMSARPDRIKHEEPIACEHPRDHRIKTSPGFVRHKARLTDEIRDETRAAVTAG